MLDSTVRKTVSGLLEPLGRRLYKKGIRANAITLIGWVFGLSSCLAVLDRLWKVALVLWLVNRAIDGVDGSVARASKPTKLGGYLDLIADFSIYGGFIAALAVVEPESRLALIVLFFTYYLSGVAFLAFTSLTSGENIGGNDGRSIRFLGGLAEGTETVLVYVLFCLFPNRSDQIAWVFSGLVFITAIHRVYFSVKTLARK